MRYDTMKNLLIINSCVNRDKSRTQWLGRKYIKSIGKDYNKVDEIILEVENLMPLSSEKLERRIKLVENKEFEDDFFMQARKLKNADKVVIFAPFWDLSFPAMLKTYIENVSVVGITFEYDNNGMPVGLCKACDFTYVSTAGGYVGDNDLGYNYISAMFKMFGIKKGRRIVAEGLDIFGNKPQDILNEAVSKL